MSCESPVIFSNFEIKRHVSFILDPLLRSHQQIYYMGTEGMAYPFYHLHTGCLTVSLMECCMLYGYFLKPYEIFLWKILSFNTRPLVSAWCVCGIVTCSVPDYWQRQQAQGVERILLFAVCCSLHTWKTFGHMWTEVPTHPKAAIGSWVLCTGRNPVQMSWASFKGNLLNFNLSCNAHLSLHINANW